MQAQTSQTIDLGFRPRPWQFQMLRHLKRYSICIVHRRGGKTVCAVMKLIDAALRCTKTRGRFAIISPELKQTKQNAWDYLRHYGGKVPGAKINESELWLEFPNGARIRLFGADSPDALRGQYFDGVVLDEVAQMKPQVWGEILVPALADRQGWALFIGTPHGINLLSELYFKAIDHPEWFAELYTFEDTHAIGDTELASMRAEMTAQQWRQEMLCDFTASSDESLISLDLVNKAIGGHIGIEIYGKSPKVLGVDVALQGADKTVIQPRQGLAALVPQALQGSTTTEIADILAMRIDSWMPDAVFIDNSGGYGAGVIDRLVTLGYAPIGVQFGGKPRDGRFLNKRAEMWWSVREWLIAGGILPKMTEYRIDLTGPTYDYANAAGKLALEPKEKMVARGLRSPDYGDALCLTFASPVAPKPSALPIDLVLESSRHLNSAAYDAYGERERPASQWR